MTAILRSSGMAVALLVRDGIVVNPVLRLLLGALIGLALDPSTGCWSPRKDAADNRIDSNHDHL